MKKLICTMIFIFCFGISVQAREITTQTNVSPNKIWTVKFTTPYDKNTLDQIKVIDSYGNGINVETKIVDDKTVTVEPVDGAWGRGVVYTLQTNNVKSSKGKQIKEPVSMKFLTGGTDYIPISTYPDDKLYLYKNMSGITWYDGDVKRQVNCYDILIFNDESGGITVSFFTDTWSTQNILKSSQSAQYIKLQIETAYKYMKDKYPNKNITVGLAYREWLNKKIDGYNNLELIYDNTVGKYKVMFLLGAIYPNETEYILNGGN